MAETKKSKLWATRRLRVLFAVILVLLIAMKYKGVLFPAHSLYIDDGFAPPQPVDHGNIEQIIQDHGH